MGTDTVSRFALVLAATSALVVAAIRLDEFVGSRRNSTQRQSAVAALQPVAVSNWQQYAVSGQTIGPLHAPVTIVEFADFECPYCRRFTEGPLKYVRTRHPGEIQVVFRNWPLPYHHLAYPAARAAECAASQGHFAAFHDLLYEKQDSLGIKSFADFARDADIPDLAEFARCVARSDSVPAISRDIRAAADLGARGTPTILVNGTLLRGSPDTATLVRLVDSIIARAGAADAMH